jgi:hypothetical protein
MLLPSAAARRLRRRVHSDYLSRIALDKGATRRSAVRARHIPGVFVAHSEVILGPHSPGSKFDSRCAIPHISNPLRRIKSVLLIYLAKYTLASIISEAWVEFQGLWYAQTSLFEDSSV